MCVYFCPLRYSHITVTLSREVKNSMNGTSCEQCLTNVTCLWCIKTKACVTYPVRTILPPHSLCPLYDARWGLCWMNFQNLIITLAVLGGVIIIALLVCMFCCCKCENILCFCLHRRAEMKQRHDDIRKKYGLSGPNPYSRFG
uniref:PTTG1 interacting protein n=1 Tax=Hippocampus comes TaxID=109280 RepID=A0A3Q2YH11_HIPCM